MKKKMSIFAITLLISNHSYANEEFDQLWKSIEQNSLALKGSSESIEAAELNFSRSRKHYLPTIYLNATSTMTNDPGANMFGLLSQRSIEQADFMPDRLNHPGNNLFNKGTIGINLPLYEGGMKEGLSGASRSQLDARKSEANSFQSELYSEVLKSYFSLKTLDKFENETGKIKKTIESILGKYQLGNKSNLLGYSGLLGLKSLNNRILAIDDETAAKRTSYVKALQELNGGALQLQSNQELNPVAEISKYTEGDSQYKASSKTNSMLADASAAESLIKVEKSKNLPRIGVFAESYAFNGKRDTGTGLSTGLYLNWNIFSGNDYGATQEAIHKSHSAKYYAEAFSQKEKIEFNSLLEMEKTLQKTMVTLSESKKLLDEQTVVANSLFKNGMINALQLTEVLARRVDLLKSVNEVEMNLIETKTKRILLSSRN